MTLEDFMNVKSLKLGISVQMLLLRTRKSSMRMLHLMYKFFLTR
jgi:hypothetical protein